MLESSLVCIFMSRSRATSFGLVIELLLQVNYTTYCSADLLSLRDRYPEYCVTNLVNGLNIRISLVFI